MQANYLVHCFLHRYYQSGEEKLLEKCENEMSVFHKRTSEYSQRRNELQKKVDQLRKQQANAQVYKEVHRHIIQSRCIVVVPMLFYLCNWTNKAVERFISWTTIVVHSRDVEDCGDAPWRKFVLKPAKIPYITMWQYWLGSTKPFRLILNAFKKLLQN